MTVSQMRAAVHEAYSGNGWGHKVANMSDIQVRAVYFSLLDRGMLDNKPVKKPTKPAPKEESKTFEHYTGEQLSLF